MRHIRIIAAKWPSVNVAAGAIVLLMTVPVLGQYKITWYTIDGGGTTDNISIDGQYKLSGTTGQPDADYLIGGEYQVLGGFWPGGPLCFVEFEDFAKFARHWLDDDADLYDLKEFSDYWLCLCPFDWPWK